MTPELIYHITTPDRWAAAQAAGAYRGDTLDTQGFIHCSLAGQVAATGERYYAGQAGLILLQIDPHLLQPELRLEPSTGGELFPHLYGPLNLDAVRKIIPFAAGADGRFTFTS
jgi:uncharacterized protein (DUF952 family)